MTLAAVHLILRNWVLSELVISGVAGYFAVVSLSRLARGRRAVLYLLTAPAAIFLMVGYCGVLVPGVRDPRLARRGPRPVVACRAPGRDCRDSCARTPSS